METCVKLKRVDMTLQNSVLALHERNGYGWAVLGLPHGPTVTFDLFTLAEKNWDLDDKKKGPRWRTESKYACE